MNSRVVTSSDIGWIVKIMCNSSTLVNCRESLCLALGLSSAQLIDIDRYSDKNARTHGYLTMALNLWISNSNSTDTTIEKLVQVLKSENLNRTAGELLRKQNEHPPNCGAANLEQNSPSVWFDVPEDVHMFTGRVEDMKELHESILAQNLEDEKNDMTVITAVCGMGGVGKTSLTIHYAWAFFKVFYVNVIWINSETKNTIADSFNRLARKLGQNTSSKLVDIVLSVYEYFGKTKTLIIFDNVECYNDVKSYIPIRSPDALRPYVLLTSRNRDWNLRTHLIDVNVFKTQESVEFFQSFLGLTTKEEMELAEKISTEVQNLPLAIRQAGAYIKVQHREGKESIVHELKAYLDLFEANSTELLKFEHWSHTADIYEKTIYTTWTVNMKDLKRQNYMTDKIIGLISYFNSDNIPVKLLLNIKDTRFWKGRVLRKTVEECDVYSAIKLLSDFSLITRHIDLESISIHRLLQKVVRDEVERKYKNTQLDCAISLIKIPLRLNNYDDYENICLIHSLFIRDYIPENRWQKKKIQSFLELINSKQDNSIDNNISRLRVLLEEDRYVDLLELHEKIRKLYVIQATRMKNNVDEIFAVRFVDTVLSCIIKDCELNSNYDGVVRHCQLVKDVLPGCNILPDYDDSYDSSMMTTTFQLVEKIYTIVVGSKDMGIETKKNILSMVYHIVVLHGEWGYDSTIILNEFCMTLLILVELSAFTEIQQFLEDHEILIPDSALPTQSNSEMLFLRNIVHELYKKLKDSNLLSIESELVGQLCIIQNKIYTFYNNEKDFESVVQNGQSLVECQLELNKPFEALTTLNSLQENVVNLALSPRHNEFNLILANTISMISKHPNGNVIRNQTIETALEVYKLNCNGVDYSKYNEHRSRYDICVFDCLVMLNQTSEISQFLQSLQLRLQNKEYIEEQFDLTYIFEFTTEILLYSGREEYKNMINTIYVPIISIVELLFGLSKQRAYSSYCTKMYSSLLLYLAGQKKYEEIITFVKDYELYLEKVIPHPGIMDFSNVILANTIMKSGEKSENENYKKKFCILAYSIYNRVYMLNSSINERLIEEHIVLDKMNPTNIMNCLAELSKCSELLNFARAYSTCLKRNEPCSDEWVILTESILRVAEHPNCPSVKKKLLLLLNHN